jgi:hypothetical protein
MGMKEVSRMEQVQPRWRKSSYSGPDNQCVELAHVGLVRDSKPRWRKSSYSGADNACVELAHVGLVRDSKNPDGPTLLVDLEPFIGVVKAG